jgi:hypothetical protein
MFFADQTSSFISSQEAERYKLIAMNTPPNAHVEMGIGFATQYTIKEFLDKANVPNLLGSITHWQGAQFRFHVHGTDANQNFVDEKFELVIECHKYGLRELPGAIMEAFDDLCKYYFDNDEPTISKMYITFQY